MWDRQTGKQVGTDLKHKSWVLSASFSPDGKFIITATRDWAYRSAFSRQSMIPLAARPLPYPFAGGIHFTDSTGDTIRVALHYTGDSIIVSTINFGVSDTPPIQGSPAELMKEWQFKLGLVLNPETG